MLSELVPTRFGAWTLVRRRARLWADGSDCSLLMDGANLGSLRLRTSEGALILLPDGCSVNWTRPEAIEPRSALGEPFPTRGNLGSWHWDCLEGVLCFRHEVSTRQVELGDRQVVVRDPARQWRFPDSAKEETAQPHFDDCLEIRCSRGVLVIQGSLSLTPRQTELLAYLLQAKRLAEKELFDQKGRRAPGEMEELRGILAEHGLSFLTKVEGIYGIDEDHERVRWSDDA